MKSLHALILGVSFGSAVTIAACGSDISQNPAGGNGGNDTNGAGANGAGANGGNGTGANGTGGSGDTGGGGAGSGASGGSTSNGGGGSGSGTGGGGGGSACAPLPDACTPCLFNQCNTLYCECFDNPACLGLALCFQQCGPGNPGCQQTCVENNSDGITDAFLLGDCGNASCGSCPAFPPLTPCSECLFQSCETQMNDCLADAQCSAAVTCVEQCGGPTPQCIAQCNPQDPNSQLLAADVVQCGGPACSNVCN
jgi:hypothetical protein